MGTAEEGVEEGGFSDVGAAEEGDFGEGRRWETAEVRGAVENFGLVFCEEGAGED